MFYLSYYRRRIYARYSSCLDPSKPMDGLSGSFGYAHREPLDHCPFVSDGPSRFFEAFGRFTGRRQQDGGYEATWEVFEPLL